jgi:RNA polymerase sigma-70 factor (ECF subfamily)
VEHIHLQEMSLAEAAARHNLSVAAVKSLLHRALTNLRRMGANHGRS